MAGPGLLNDAIGDPHRCEEFDYEFMVQTKTWQNGRTTARLTSPDAVMTFRVTWDGLTYDQADALSNHYWSAKGMYLPFTFRFPRNNLIYTVRYTTTFQAKQVRPAVTLYKVDHILREHR